MPKTFDFDSNASGVAVRAVLHTWRRDAPATLRSTTTSIASRTS